MPLNMKKEIRAELQLLRNVRRKVNRDWRSETDNLCRRQRQLDRDIWQMNKSCSKVIKKIDRRIAILRGRLS